MPLAQNGRAALLLRHRSLFERARRQPGSVLEQHIQRECAHCCRQDEEANKLPAYSKYGQISVKGLAVSVPIGMCFIVVSRAAWRDLRLFMHAALRRAFGHVRRLSDLHFRRTFVRIEALISCGHALLRV